MVVPTHELMTRMRLRGAGVNDAVDDQDSVADDTTVATYSGPEDTDSDTISPHLALQQDDGASHSDDRVYLWGLSGRTVFSYFDAKSFFAAIDRNLGLIARGDGNNPVGISITLLSHPRNEGGPCRVLASDQCFLGRCEQDELNFYKTWLDTVRYFDDEIDDGDVLDICVARISQDVHFSDMQQNLAYRPSLQDDRVVVFSLPDDKNDALAYLFMGQEVVRQATAVQYKAWFKSLWRSLSHPTEEQLKTYAIGSKEALPPRSSLISITSADASIEAELHWFYSDVGPTSEAWNNFIDAYCEGGHRQFTLNAIPMTDPRASCISVPTGVVPVAIGTSHIVKEVQERDKQFYWGCHSHVEEAIAFQETDEPSIRSATARAAARNPLGRPDNGVQLDDFAKGKVLREWSYAHPLSIHMQDQHPSIPINAPPLETILKTPGIDGKPSESVPVISTQVLTPTEQRRLQETVFEMRNLALNRAQPCPFRPCNKNFTIDDAGRQHFRDHIQSTHIDRRCPFCDDKMFGYYDERTKQQHFYEKHVYYFSHKDDLRLNTLFDVKSMELTHERETKWNFCARCGRDHNQLNVNGDRAQHDNICFPGVTEKESRQTYCVDCGESIRSATRHVCTSDSSADPGTRPVHCKKCALPTHKLARSYAEKHLARCRGSHSDKAHWCPWCGQNFAIYSRTQTYKHLDECTYMPPTGEGPINTTTGEPNESPTDNRTTRYWAKAHHSNKNETRNIVQVPDECLVKGCTKKHLQELNADALLDHYSTETHANATSRLKFCPFCNIDFSERGWVEKQQKVAHFKDHVEEREKRIHLDLEIAGAPNKLDAAILEKIKLRNEDEFASKTGQGRSEQAGGHVLSSKLGKDVEQLLEEQKRAKEDAEIQFSSLEASLSKFTCQLSSTKTLTDEYCQEILMDAFAQNPPAKRSREPTSSVEGSDEGSSKRQRTNDLIGINTSQKSSPDRESWVTTPSTGSSRAIMTPSDDVEPTTGLGFEQLPSSAPSRSSSTSIRTKYPNRTAVRTQGSDTQMDPGIYRHQTSIFAGSVPITLAPQSTSTSLEIPSGGTGARTRARQARIARTGKDEQAVTVEDDDDDDDDEI